jgi:hypothetical protein
LCQFTAGLKAELFSKLRIAFENRAVRVPSSSEIREDLHGVQRVASRGGQVSYRAAQSEDGHSDRCTALALALRAAGEARGEGGERAGDLAGAADGESATEASGMKMNFNHGGREARSRNRGNRREEILILPRFEFLNVSWRSNLQQLATDPLYLKNRVPVCFQQKFGFASLIEWNRNYVRKHVAAEFQLTIRQITRQFRNRSFDDTALYKYFQLLRPTGAFINSRSSLGRVNIRRVEMQNYRTAFLLNSNQPGIVDFHAPVHKQNLLERTK